MAKKVLVVDDDPTTVRFLTVALEENGYEVVSAPDGKEGYERAKEESPDLILLDVMMPKRTGFTMFKQLRKDDQLGDIPVIMLTGVAAVLAEQDEMASDNTFEQPYDALRERLRKAIEEVRGAGSDHPEVFIEKPIDPERVINTVRELIGS